MRRDRKVCVLVSGGLDSGILLTRLLPGVGRVVPVYVRCGLRWERAEVYWLRRLLQAIRSPRLAPLRIIELPLRSVYGAHWSVGGRRVPSTRSADAAVYLPGRNLVLLGVAGIVCAQERLSAVVLGTLNGNPFGDASPRFFAQMGRCLSLALSAPTRILAPLARIRKRDLIRHARRAPLALTFSCLRPMGLTHCGRCNKCAERRRAFHQADIPDPTTYASDGTAHV